MNASRIALVAAAASLLLWAAKSVAIGTAGGLDRSPLESPLFLAGLVAQVVATIALGLALSRSRPGLIRVGAAAATLVAVLGLVTVVNLVVQRVQPVDASWVWAEINLWFVAAVLLGLAVWAVRRAGRSARELAA